MTGRVQDLILNPNETGKITEVISEGEYYGMQTFDQALLKHVMAGTIAEEDAMTGASSPHDFKLMLQAERPARVGHRAGHGRTATQGPRRSRSPTSPSPRRNAQSASFSASSASRRSSSRFSGGLYIYEA